MRKSKIVALAILFLAVAAAAQTTNGLSEAEIKGRELAQKILEQKPTVNAVQTGILKIQDAKGISTNLFLKCRIITDGTNWVSYYVVSPTNSFSIFTRLEVNHGNNTNRYALYYCCDGNWDESCLCGINLVININTSFVNSDFWLCDLGLEFFHWPEQKVLKHEFRRTRGCDVLRSTNPDPSPEGYSRVVSWIDDETLGIVHAEAYDANGKLLKVFDPKEFKKVNGQWQLQEMEIRNVQTGSRTWMEFDLPQEK
ncbi:MAG TPA: outer membrane lipoprotein-sorting protein [Verrucomicrobiae bacterium]|nr:outer membrane lipoprotein-sorting protein [Verrucomicrobiae bacterium]